MSDETFPVEVAVELRSKGDQDKLSAALDRLAQEGLSFGTSVDDENSQTLIRGRDEIHLEIIVRRLVSELKVEVNVGAPQVAYRETITKTVEHDYTFKKQTGGYGQFAKVKIRFEPLARGSGFVFKSDLVGGAVPTEFIPGVEEGLKLAKESGVIAGFPMIDFKATLIDGAYHDCDSSVVTFDTAARACYREGIPKAGPKLLEPIMKVEVVTPEEYIGDVLGDFCSRRGQVAGVEARGNAQVVFGMVPFANMFGYATALLEMTKGHAEYDVQFDHYDQMPHRLPPNGGGDAFQL